MASNISFILNSTLLTTSSISLTDLGFDGTSLWFMRYVSSSSIEFFTGQSKLKDVNFLAVGNKEEAIIVRDKFRVIGVAKQGHILATLLTAQKGINSFGA
ncbi:unnamed protein product [Citrullus colocynthis]|uniref:Uncharacterized protein n=1 Tax=Citrullus colocynthis TaxID=252529 RepID=A0ABP0XN22_9ROSI